MGSWTGENKLEFKPRTEYDDPTVQVWVCDYTGKADICFQDLDDAGRGIRTKAEAKKLIKFLQDNMGLLK